MSVSIKHQQEEEDGEMKQSAKEKYANAMRRKKNIVCNQMWNVRIEAQKPCIHTLTYKYGS